MKTTLKIFTMLTLIITGVSLVATPSNASKKNSASTTSSAPSSGGGQVERMIGASINYDRTS
jgi:hypothetical protein